VVIKIKRLPYNSRPRCYFRARRCNENCGIKLTLIIWTNLTVSLDGQQTANTLFVKMLDHVYVVSPLR